MDPDVPDIPELPLDLRIVAWLNILGGFVAVFEVLTSCASGHMNFNFGVLGIFLGYGLLRLSSGWRTFGIVSLSIPVVAVPLIALSGPPDRAWILCITLPVREIGDWWVLIALAVWGANVWELCVLCRSGVRELFQEADERGP